MSKLAFLFPGQASQYPGMGKDLAANFAESRAVFRRSGRRAGIFDFAALLRGFRGRAQADGKHAAGDPDGFRRGLSRAGGARNRAGFRGGAQPGRIFGAGRRRGARILDRREAGPPARALHAGSGARRRRRDGGDSGPFSGGCGRSLQEGGGRRSGFAREFEFAGANRDRRKRGGRETRRGNRLASWRQARRDSGRFGALSLRAADASAAAPGGRPARREVQQSAISADYQRGRRGHHFG